MCEDDDGEVMSDFPMIHGSELAMRIGFSALAVCEDNLYDEGSGSASGRTYPVRVSHVGGAIEVRVRSVGTRMRDVLRLAMAEVRPNVSKEERGRYVLQWMNRRKEDSGEWEEVDPNQTLKSTESFSFFLIRKHSSRV